MAICYHYNGVPPVVVLSPAVEEFVTLPLGQESISGKDTHTHMRACTHTHAHTHAHTHTHTHIHTHTHACTCIHRVHTTNMFNYT